MQQADINARIRTYTLIMDHNASYCSESPLIYFYKSYHIKNYSGSADNFSVLG